MRIQYIKFLAFGLATLILAACGPDGLDNLGHIPADVTKNGVDAPLGTFHEEETSSLCPAPDFAPSKTISYEADSSDPLVDHDQEAKDLSTKFVVNQFFTTKDTLFNFMKLVYGNINRLLEDYRNKLGLEERSIFLVFKGGNVLRMVANKVFDLLPPDIKAVLEEEYAEYFTRSDADFSVYVDETKLRGLDYERIFIEINELIFAELDNIRKELTKNAGNYFNFFQLKPDGATKILSDYINKLENIDAIKDTTNENWHNAKPYQLQLSNERAKQSPNCSFHGQYDYRYLQDAGKKLTLRLSRTANWIANSDNRTIRFTWGSDPNKIVKFYLVRSKAIFETYFEKDGDIKRKPIGGELIDVSLPHRLDDRLRPFLDNYDKTVATYTITSKEAKETLDVKSYSLQNLAEDLQFIIFDSFDRPWQGGLKYKKRVYRLFFLYIVEMLGKTGSGSDTINTYINDIKDKIINPLQSLYPITDNSTAIAEQLKANAEQIHNTWKEMPLANEFWKALSEFVESRLVKKPQDSDQEGLKKFLEFIGENLDVMNKLASMNPVKINLEEIYKIDINQLF